MAAQLFPQAWHMNRAAEGQEVASFSGYYLAFCRWITESRWWKAGAVNETTSQDSSASYKVLWSVCALIYSAFHTRSNFCFSKLPPVLNYIEQTRTVCLLWCWSHDESITVSKVISYCVCKLQSLKCASFSAKCSHYACHSECWYIFTFVTSYRWY